MVDGQSYVKAGWGSLNWSPCHFHPQTKDMQEIEYDSEDDTLEDLYDGEDDVDAEAEEDRDVLLNITPGEGADDATEDGDDVCVPASRDHYS